MRFETDSQMSGYTEEENSNYLVKIHKKLQTGKRRFSTGRNSKNCSPIHFLRR